MKEPVMILSMSVKPSTYKLAYADYMAAKLKDPKMTWDKWLLIKIDKYVPPSY